MKLFNMFAATLFSAALAYSSFALAEDNTSFDVLTGDMRLACEAILCLSSGDRPSECAPSIQRYFSIQHKKWKDTLNARRDFLNLCPSSKEQGMNRLINTLVNGAGRCDAKELNRVMRRSYQEQVCQRTNHKDNDCRMITKYYISYDKPSYCTEYFNHEWTTAEDKVHFIGTEKKGGKWVDVK